MLDKLTHEKDNDTTRYGYRLYNDESGEDGFIWLDQQIEPDKLVTGLQLLTRHEFSAQYRFQDADDNERFYVFDEELIAKAIKGSHPPRTWDNNPRPDYRIPSDFINQRSPPPLDDNSMEYKIIKHRDKPKELVSKKELQDLLKKIEEQESTFKLE